MHKMPVKSTFSRLIAALLFAAVCISAEDANPNKMKKFLSKPLVIEDQSIRLTVESLDVQIILLSASKNTKLSQP